MRTQERTKMDSTLFYSKPAVSVTQERKSALEWTQHARLVQNLLRSAELCGQHISTHEQLYELHHACA